MSSSGPLRASKPAPSIHRIPPFGVRSRRTVMLERDRWCCQLCGRPLPEIDASIGRPLTCDHIRPRQRHGENDLTNVWSLCSECHQQKSWWNVDYMRYQNSGNAHLIHSLARRSMEDGGPGLPYLIVSFIPDADRLYHRKQWVPTPFQSRKMEKLEARATAYRQQIDAHYRRQQRTGAAAAAGYP